MNPEQFLNLVIRPTLQVVGLHSTWAETLGATEIVGPRNTTARSYKYTGFLGNTYSHGASDPYPWQESSVPIYRGDELVATFDFITYGEYGHAQAGASRSGNQNRARTVFVGFTEENSSGFVVGDFTVEIANNVRTVWDGTLHGGIPVYSTGNYSDGVVYGVKIAHDLSGAEVGRVQVSVLTISTTTAIK